MVRLFPKQRFTRKYINQDTIEKFQKIGGNF